jgi:stage II sporulation protein P
LDLHRDGIAGPSDDNITAVMAGERLARISFIVGQGQPEFPNPHWEKNQALAQDLHNRLEQMYPGLSRGVTLRKWPYNQELSAGGLLVEVGDHNNTRAEAMRSAILLADVVADVLKERLNTQAKPTPADKGGKA